MSKKIEIILKRHKRDKTPFILNLLFISISIVTLYLSINNSYYFFFISVPSSIFSLWSISILFENAKHDYEDYLKKEKEKKEWESKSAEERDRIIKYRVKSAKEDLRRRMEGDRKWREYNEKKKNSKISDD